MGTSADGCKTVSEKNFSNTKVSMTNNSCYISDLSSGWCVTVTMIKFAG